MASREEFEIEIMPANDLRVGNYAIVQGKTCKVLEIHRSKTGKHGGAKLHLVALDIFSRKKVEGLVNSSKTVDVPCVKKDEYPIISIDGDGYLTLSAKDGSLRSDILVADNDDIRKIESHLDDDHSMVATLISAMGREAFDSFKRKYVK